MTIESKDIELIAEGGSLAASSILVRGPTVEERVGALEGEVATLKALLLNDGSQATVCDTEVATVRLGSR